MFSSPLLLSYTGRYISSLPHLAFSLLMLAAWHCNRRGWLTVIAFLLTFTRITGCLSVLSLGLLDLCREVYTHRFHRPRHMMILMLPYLVCGLVFIAYLVFKLFVLDRPLTNIQGNILKSESFSILQQFRIILDHSFNQPRFSFSLFLIPVVFVLALHVRRRFHGKKLDQVNSPPLPSNPVFILCFSWSFSSPRFFMPFITSGPRPDGS
jgi:hypothetical protein